MVCTFPLGARKIYYYNVLIATYSYIGFGIRLLALSLNLLIISTIIRSRDKVHVLNRRKAHRQFLQAHHRKKEACREVVPVVLTSSLSRPGPKP